MLRLLVIVWYKAFQQNKSIVNPFLSKDTYIFHILLSTNFNQEFKWIRIWNVVLARVGWKSLTHTRWVTKTLLTDDSYNQNYWSNETNNNKWDFVQRMWAIKYSKTQLNIHVCLTRHRGIFAEKLNCSEYYTDSCSSSSTYFQTFSFFKSYF